MLSEVETSLALANERSKREMESPAWPALSAVLRPRLRFAFAKLRSE
jgi:hypothetical protein